MPCDLRTTQGGRESSTILLEVRPTRGNASNASQLATEPKIARKSTLRHAKPANKEVIGRGTALSPEGEGGLLLPRWPCWKTEVAQGVLRLAAT